MRAYAVWERNVIVAVFTTVALAVCRLAYENVPPLLSMYPCADLIWNGIVLFPSIRAIRN